MWKKVLKCHQRGDKDDQNKNEDNMYLEPVMQLYFDVRGFSVSKVRAEPSVSPEEGTGLGFRVRSRPRRGSDQSDLHRLLSPLHLSSRVLFGRRRSSSDRADGSRRRLRVFGRLRGALDWTVKRALSRPPVVPVVVRGWASNGGGGGRAGLRGRGGGRL